MRQPVCSDICGVFEASTVSFRSAMASVAVPEVARAEVADVTMAPAEVVEETVEVLKKTAHWTEHCSLHLRYFEKRAMEADSEAHEVRGRKYVM